MWKMQIESWVIGRIAFPSIQLITSHTLADFSGPLKIPNELRDLFICPSSGIRVL